MQQNKAKLAKKKNNGTLVLGSSQDLPGPPDMSSRPDVPPPSRKTQAPVPPSINPNSRSSSTPPPVSSVRNSSAPPPANVRRSSSVPPPVPGQKRPSSKPPMVTVSAEDAGIIRELTDKGGIKNAVQEMREDLDSALKANDGLSDELSDEQRRYRELQEEFTNLMAERDNFFSANRTLVEKVENLTADLASTQKELKRVRLEWGSSVEKLATDATQMDFSGDLLNSLTAQSEELTKEKSGLLQELAEANETKESFAEEVGQLSQKKMELENGLNTAIEDIKQLTKANQDLQQANELLEKTQARLTEEKRELAQERSELLKKMGLQDIRMHDLEEILVQLANNVLIVEGLQKDLIKWAQDSKGLDSGLKKEINRAATKVVAVVKATEALTEGLKGDKQMMMSFPEQGSCGGASPCDEDSKTQQRRPPEPRIGGPSSPFREEEESHAVRNGLILAAVFLVGVMGAVLWLKSDGGDTSVENEDAAVAPDVSSAPAEVTAPPVSKPQAKVQDNSELEAKVAEATKVKDNNAKAAPTPAPEPGVVPPEEIVFDSVEDCDKITNQTKRRACLNMIAEQLGI